MSVIKKPDLTDPKLRAKLAKGMGHNYYGEPAWPNDLLYVFPICILGTFACCIGLGVLAPTQLGEPADPFNTPLEILPEWYFFPTFNLLRVLPNKLLGVLKILSFWSNDLSINKFIFILAGEDKVFRGVESRHNTNDANGNNGGGKDRIWKFEYCTIVQ